MRWDAVKGKTSTADAAMRARSSIQRRSRPTFRGVESHPKRRVVIRQTDQSNQRERPEFAKKRKIRQKRTAMRPRVSRRLAASAVVMAARATVLRSARLLSFAGAATREQRVVEVIANMMMIDASAFL
jgi:hypothetical protein